MTSSLADTLVRAVELEAERLRRERANRASLRRAYRLETIAHTLARDDNVRAPLRTIDDGSESELVAEALSELEIVERSHPDEPVQHWLGDWAHALADRFR